MCGIVGYVGKRKQNGIPLLIKGLKRLEYRGYDSAGLAFVVDNQLVVKRAAGKLHNLESLLSEGKDFATSGIGHTRWATHGKPSTYNAHPHTDCGGKIALVHNGIIENYLALKEELIANGHKFKSDTDTEVIVHLIEQYWQGDMKLAIRKTVARLEGTFAIAVVSTKTPNRIFAARRFSPLIVGLGEREYLLASDIPAILPYTNQEIVIENDQLVELSEDGMEISDLKHGNSIEPHIETIAWSAEQAEKAGYTHYMLKEIYEQPMAIRETMFGRIREREVDLSNDIHQINAAKIDQIQIVACGTSYHAGLTGKYILEALTGLPVEVDLASEYRYRRVIGAPHSLVIALSQSGETADTLGAMREAQARGWPLLGICNVVGSSVPRLANDCIYTKAGPEIGVASTKAFTSQLVALYLFALHCAIARNQISTRVMAEMIDALKRLPHDMELALTCRAQVAAIAAQFTQVHNTLYLGRWLSYPVALEGALKLKEIAYINAQGYAAGEMKHGPIALIEEGMPVVVMAARNHVYEKVISNMEEVRARGGSIIAIVEEGDREAAAHAQHVITLPRTHALLTPILQVVPLQLLAYHLGLLRGCDVDQPRNLAKSVTVE